MKRKTVDLKIDWNWVKKELSEKERIPNTTKGGPKHIIHVAVDSCIEEAKSLANPRIISETKKVALLKPNFVEIEGSVRFSGRRLASYLKDSSDVCLFLVTIGNLLEDKASAYMARGEPLYGYLLDKIGALAAESVAESVEENLRKIYLGKGKSVSMRLSPGYCDWPIEEQFILAKALDFSKAGVSLTKQCMMVPRKSISAMVGIGPKGLFSKRESQCEICDKKECDYRRAYDVKRV